MNDYFHAGFSRADAADTLFNMHQEDADESFVLFRTGSEPGTYAVSTISEHGKIRHYKVRELKQRLGMCDADGQVQNYMDVHVFLQKIQDMGTLLQSPQSRPLFPHIK
jgi:hypothetical protein